MGEEIKPVGDKINIGAPNQQEELGKFDRVIKALSQREAYSPETVQENGKVDLYQLKPEERAFVQKFLDFEVPIPEGTEPDYLIVPTASKLIDRNRYRDRVVKTVDLGNEHPETKIIFSGKMPAAERRTGKEEGMPSEAEQMAADAEKMGIDSDRVIKETASGHIRENIEFSLQMLKDQIEQSSGKVKIAVVVSKSALRRCYYAANKLLQEEFPEIADRVDFYFVAAGDDLNDRVKYYNDKGEVVDEGGYFAYYEMRRLLEYRKKGWL